MPKRKRPGGLAGCPGLAAHVATARGAAFVVSAPCRPRVAPMSEMDTALMFVLLATLAEAVKLRKAAHSERKDQSKESEV